MYPFLPDVSVSNKVTLSPSPPGSWLTPLSLGISLLTRLAQGQLGTSPQWARGEDLCSTVEKMLSPHPLGAGTYVVPATAGICVLLTKEILETKPMQESLPGTPFLWFPPQVSQFKSGLLLLAAQSTLIDSQPELPLDVFLEPPDPRMVLEKWLQVRLLLAHPELHPYTL